MHYRKEQRTSLQHKGDTTGMLKVPEASKTLGLSVPAVWKLIYDGKLPYVKIGRSVRLREEDVQAFIKQNLTRHER
jgi:excisionase family DNA binding protein